MTDPIISPSILLKPLVPIFKLILPKARRLHAERQAARGNAHPENSLLEAEFTTSINRLIGIENAGSWWRKIVDKAENAYVEPEFLNGQSIKAWLKDRQVHDDLKILARNRLITPDSDDDPSDGDILTEFS